MAQNTPADWQGDYVSFHRNNRTRDFTVMGNIHLRDKNLSLKAVGLLSKMLSFNDGWQFSTRGLAAIQLEKAGFDYLLRHILAIDADGRRSGTDGIQHDVHDLPEAVFIELWIQTENVVIKIIFDNLFILASLIHPVHPIKIDGLIVL